MQMKILQEQITKEYENWKAKEPKHVTYLKRQRW
jgi:hypothetical protein